MNSDLVTIFGSERPDDLTPEQRMAFLAGYRDAANALLPDHPLSILPPPVAEGLEAFYQMGWKKAESDAEEERRRNAAIILAGI